MKKAYLFILLSALLLSSCSDVSESNTSKIGLENIEIKASEGFDTNQSEVQTTDGIKENHSDAAEDSKAYDGINDKERDADEKVSSSDNQPSAGNDKTVPYLDEDSVNIELDKIIRYAKQRSYKGSLSNLLMMRESRFCRLSSSCEYANMLGNQEYILTEGDSFTQRMCALCLMHGLGGGMPADVYKTLVEYYPSRITYHPEVLYDYKDYNNGYYEVEYDGNIIQFILPAVEGQSIDIQISVKGAEFSEYQINGIKYQLDDHPYFDEEKNKIEEPCGWNFINEEFLSELTPLFGAKLDDLVSDGIVEVISKMDTMYYDYYICRYGDLSVGLCVYNDNVVSSVEIESKSVLTEPELYYKKITEASPDYYVLYWDYDYSIDTDGLYYGIIHKDYGLSLPSDEDGNILSDRNCSIIK